MGKNNCDCNLNIFGLIRSIQSCMCGKVEDKAKEIGLNSTQMLIAHEIYENPDISLNGLCERLELPKSTVSRLVEELVRKGVLLREIPEENRRIVRLRVSEEYKFHASLGTVGKNLIGKMDDERSKRILSALEELKSALNEAPSEKEEKGEKE